MSQYGGEITSRSGHPSPAREKYPALLDNGDRSRESPLRRSPSSKAYDMPRQNVVAENNTSLANDSKLDANAYMMHHMSTQKSISAYDGHKSSVNESSIHNKLSALRNVFSQIR